MAACPEVRESLTRLDRVAAKRPELTDLVQVYRDLIPGLFGRATVGPTPAISDDHATEKLAAGVPLLCGESLEIPHDAWRENWAGVCSVLIRHGDAERTRRLAAAVDAGEIRIEEILHAVLATGVGILRELSERHGLDEHVGSSLLRYSALPLLAPIAKELERKWQSSGWSHGYCPVCGSWPRLAELRGLEQLRWLRCGLCATGWQVDRIFCPFCETRDHRKLQDLFVEGEAEKYRVTVCDACRGFVPSIATLVPLTTAGVLVAELETLHMTLVAQRSGYAVPEERLSNTTLEPT